jgi:hypothetical protein
MLGQIASAVLPSLIQGGFSLLGGGGKLSQRKQMAYQNQYAIQQMNHQNAIAKEWAAYDRDKYVRLAQDAQRGGFNPLTALRGGGGAGYQQTHAPVLSATGVYSSETGGNTAAGVFGNAIANGVQAAFDYDPLQEERAQIELDIMKGQLRRIQEGNTAEYTRLGSVPTATGSRYTTAGNASLAKGGEMEQGQRVATNPFDKRTGILVDPNKTDVQNWEDRYGEIVGGLLGGAYNVYHDYKYNNRAPDDRTSNNDDKRWLNEFGQAWDRFRVANGAKPKYSTGKNSF